MKATFTLLFLILAITCTVIAQDFNAFVEKHYENGMTVQNCNRKMARINRLYYHNRCKEVNSVISTASTNLIVAVCAQAGEPYPMPDGRILRRSLQQFRVITCTHRGGSDRPPCEYRGSNSMRNIVIDCRGGRPVHYEEGHI